MAPSILPPHHPPVLSNTTHQHVTTSAISPLRMMRPDAPHTYHHNVTSPSTPVVPAPTTTQPRQAATPPHLTNTQRLLGIDLARGLALIGMMAAHFMLSTTPELLNPTTWGGLVNGRSSILFATLAGVSLALTTGRTTPPTGDDLIAARGKSSSAAPPSTSLEPSSPPLTPPSPSSSKPTESSSPSPSHSSPSHGAPSSSSPSPSPLLDHYSPTA